MVSHSGVHALLKDPNDHSLINPGNQVLPMHFPGAGELEIVLPAKLLHFPTVERRSWRENCSGGGFLSKALPCQIKKTGKKHLLPRIQGMGCDSGVLNGKAAAIWLHLSTLPESAQPCRDSLPRVQWCQRKGGITWHEPEPMEMWHHLALSYQDTPPAISPWRQLAEGWKSPGKLRMVTLPLEVSGL